MNHGDERRGGEVDEIRLALPALATYGRVARLAVTGLASRNGFSYDDVQDLRIAVGEVFGLLVEPEDGKDRLRFTCWLQPDALEIECTRVPTAAIAEVGELSRQILDAVVDHAEIDQPGGRIRIVKRLRA